jgi:hypothetical protein
VVEYNTVVQGFWGLAQFAPELVELRNLRLQPLVRRLPISIRTKQWSQIPCVLDRQFIAQGHALRLNGHNLLGSFFLPKVGLQL